MQWKTEIDLAAIILLTSVTGSVLLIVWYSFCRLLERAGFYDMFYPMLKLAVVSFLIPAIYVWFSWSTWNIGTFEGKMFVPTIRLVNWARVFLNVWGIGCICVLGYYLYTGLQFRKRIRKAMPVEPEVQGIFKSVCREAGVKPKRFQVRECYGVPGPFLVGVIHPRIILPVGMKDENELRVVFFHELQHGRQKDILWKRIILLIGIIQWFNPCVWWLMFLFDRWCEYSCDKRACQKAGGIKKYFEVILAIIQREDGIPAAASVCLAEKKSDLRKRVEHIKNAAGKSGKSGFIARIACMALVLSGCVSAYAVTSAMAEQYVEVYDDTAINLKIESIAFPEYEETVQTGIGSHIRVEEGEITAEPSDGATFYHINWQVEHNMMKQSPSFYIGSGHLTVMISSTPEEAEFEVGIIDQQGNRRSIKGNDCVGYFFVSIPCGNYRVYVLNESGKALETVEGDFVD